MYSHIKRLRVGGKRKADRDISADTGVIGHISVFRQGGEVVAAAYAVGSAGLPAPLIPLLYRAKVVTMQGDGMLFQGWERPHGADRPDTDANKQEWSVKLMVAPPHEPQPTERMGLRGPTASLNGENIVGFLYTMRLCILNKPATF